VAQPRYRYTMVMRTVVETRDPLGIYTQRKVLLFVSTSCVNRCARSVDMYHGGDNNFSLFRLSEEEKPAVYTFTKFGL